MNASLGQVGTINRAVADAVNLVNSHSGQACVHLRFAEYEEPIDFVANAGFVRGEQFVFTAGFESIEGSIRELADIRAELIN